jgi:hypothetical protein
MDATSREEFTAEKFSAVVLYEDRLARDRALAISRSLESQVGDEVELQFSWWKFEFLRDPKLAEAAAHAATFADMLLVSARAGHGLPPFFNQWVETWLPRRRYREGALVALIGSGNEAVRETAPATEHLRAIARRGAMDFLAPPLALLGNISENLPESLRQRAETRTATLDAILNQPPPPSHFGII